MPRLPLPFVLASLHIHNIAEVASFWRPHEGKLVKTRVAHVCLVAENDDIRPEDGVEEASGREQGTSSTPTAFRVSCQRTKEIASC